jgi:hypothetical protein
MSDLELGLQQLNTIATDLGKHPAAQAIKQSIDLIMRHQEIAKAPVKPVQKDS